jgi:hypothetical protein
LELVSPACEAETLAVRSVLVKRSLVAGKRPVALGFDATAF